MVVKFLTFSKFHNKKGVGSTRIRVDNLLKYWPEASLYRYGDKADVLIFQKVYCTEDYDFPEAYKSGLKILDVCDPDWLDGMFIKRTVDAMDAVVVPTKALQEFIKQMTDKPVVVIKDRFDISEFPKPKVHEGKAKRAVWFGYSHNAGSLKFTVTPLERMGFSWTIIANENPNVERWGLDSKNYTYKKFNQETLYAELQKSDICVLPKGSRPQDRFKSNNKTIIANLCGLPVAYDLESLEPLLDGKTRQEVAEAAYKHAVENYNCEISVREYKELIDELRNL